MGHNGSRPRCRAKDRRPSRAQALAALMRDAAAVAVDDSYDVVVVGGGAAGLAASIVAAEGGARTLVLEAAPECGRSILATGNGRCNLSNVELGPDAYNDPNFVGDVFGDDPLKDILDFFRECGLRWSLEGARLYPVSRSAASVRNVLLARARRTDVTLAPARRVTSVTPADAGFEVAYERTFDDSASRVRARAVIVATGGGACEALTPLGLESTPLSRVLCPVGCDAPFLAELDGRRAQARVQLSHGTFPCWSERGEVLFRTFGLSGIVVFNLSREAREGDLVELDLACDLAPSELQQLVDPFARGSFEHGCLDGVLDPRIAATIERLARERWQLSGLERDAPASDSAALITLAKSLPLRVTGVMGGEAAQVTRGGLRNSQFSTSTLECAARPRLFACGEALDVDGACGGFNLSWAWKSGMVAGRAAANAAAGASGAASDATEARS